MQLSKNRGYEKHSKLNWLAPRKLSTSVWHYLWRCWFCTAITCDCILCFLLFLMAFETEPTLCVKMDSVSSRVPCQPSMTCSLTESARLAATLRHAGWWIEEVRKVSHGGRRGGRWNKSFYRLQWTLSYVEARAWPNSGEAAGLLQQMLLALSYLHSHGVVHRDRTKLVRFSLRDLLRLALCLISCLRSSELKGP